MLGRLSQGDSEHLDFEFAVGGTIHSRVGRLIVCCGSKHWGGWTFEIGRLFVVTRSSNGSARASRDFPRGELLSSGSSDDGRD